LFWADQLLDALNYLHSHEPPIVHRDIKPQNLKLTDENHIVLLDFGLSKNSVGETRVTTAGSVVGYTPHYAPMEQIRGTGTDARSDIYSLATTLYQILTNTVPPDALTRADSLINGMPDPVTPISAINPEVSKAVSDVIIKGMSISQEQRYKNAREMQKNLRDAYARLQDDMSANTLAFNASNPPAELPQSPQKTAELSGMPLVSQMPAQSQAMPTANDSDAAIAKTKISEPLAPNKTEPNFDATIRYDSEVPEPSPKQSDIKTEVFLAGSSSAIASVQEENHALSDSFPRGKSYANGGNVTQDEDFTAKNDFDSAENYSPSATVPLFTFDKNDEVADDNDFNSISERGDDKISTGGGTFMPPPVVSQKSSGKGLAIAGGLFALLFLAISVAGIGWYLLKDRGTTTDNIPMTPTPEASVSVTPTAVEVVTETNSLATNTSTNNGDETLTNTNSDVTSTNTSEEVNSTIGTTPTQATVQSTPVRATTPKKQTPQVTTVKTPTATSKTPTSASPPKRTDIEQ
jgi:serine/threonine protein kinase